MTKAAEDLYRINFGVHKSLRYHAKRRAFFDNLHRGAMAVSAIAGSAAFFALVGDGTSVAQMASFVAATAAGLDLALGFPEKARDHDKLYEQFSDFAARLAKVNAQNVSASAVRAHTAERLLLEKREPTVLAALNVICHNEEACARRHGREETYVVSWLQRLVAQFFTFPGFDPKSAGKTTAARDA